MPLSAGTRLGPYEIVAPPAGTRLGPYEIVAPLGAGGIGEVFRAKDTHLGRDVAIKVLPQHLSENPDVRALRARGPHRLLARPCTHLHAARCRS